METTWTVEVTGPELSLLKACVIVARIGEVVRDDAAGKDDIRRMKELETKLDGVRRTGRIGS